MERTRTDADVDRVKMVQNALKCNMGILERSATEGAWSLKHGEKTHEEYEEELERVGETTPTAAERREHQNDIPPMMERACGLLARHDNVALVDVRWKTLD